MLSILLTVCFGLAIGYFATQNTAPVSLQLGEFVVDNVPLYMVAVGSLLAGVFIAWGFYLVRTFSTSLTALGNARHDSRVDRNMVVLERRVRDLETGNVQAKSEHSSDSRTSIAA